MIENKRKKQVKKETLIRIAALIGLLDSIYLTYVKLSHTPIYCTPGLGDCATVNSSRWSEIWGIPISVFGLLTYFAILLLSFLGKRVKFTKPFSDYLVFGLAMIGLLFSIYLTYLEAFVIRAFCQWCVLSAISVFVIFIAGLALLLEKNAIEIKEEIYAKD
jgi:uncharacterized membrane protein